MTNAEYIKSKITDRDLISAVLGGWADTGILSEAWYVYDAWEGKRENRTCNVNFLNWLDLKYNEKDWEKNA